MVALTRLSLLRNWLFLGEPEISLFICLEVAAVLTREPERAWEMRLTLPSRLLLRFHSSRSFSSSIELELS